MDGAANIGTGGSMRSLFRSVPFCCGTQYRDGALRSGCFGVWEFVPTPRSPANITHFGFSEGITAIFLRYFRDIVAQVEKLLSLMKW